MLTTQALSEIHSRNERLDRMVLTGRPIMQPIDTAAWRTSTKNNREKVLPVPLHDLSASSWTVFEHSYAVCDCLSLFRIMQCLWQMFETVPSDSATKIFADAFSCRCPVTFRVCTICKKSLLRGSLLHYSLTNGDKCEEMLTHHPKLHKS